MDHSSRTKRFALPSRLGLVVLLLVAGCQSGGQTDLVTRELRTQEDQIYAMEDYLAQYQQLLCQMRAENAALKRQLAETDCDGDLPTPSASQKEAPRSKPERTKGPAFQTPGRTPPGEDEQSTPEMEIEIIEPDVPPLEETTLNRPRLEVRGQSPDAPAGVPAKFVQIRGEVIANETGGGPRLAVDVEPLSVTFEPTPFAGAVSLMLLEPTNDGPPRSLARWDFSAADAQAVLAEMPQHQTMRFHLELPPDVPTDGKTEVWVRLTLEDGGKVLEHVRVDLSQPGEFASMVGGAAPRDGWDDRQSGGSLAAIADRDNSVATTATSASAFDRGDYDGWTIARPDRPGQLAAGGGDSSAEWRAATRPSPVVVKDMTPVRPAVSRPVVRQAAFVEAVKTPQAPAVPVIRTAPAWSAERGGEPQGVAKTRSDGRRASAAPARPTWSPLR